MMNITKEYLIGYMDAIDYSLDFLYNLDKRYKKMYHEDNDYCELILDVSMKKGQPFLINYLTRNLIN